MTTRSEEGVSANFMVVDMDNLRIDKIRVLLTKADESASEEA